VDIGQALQTASTLLSSTTVRLRNATRASELNPEYFLLHYVLGRAYAQKKMYRGPSAFWRGLSTPILATSF